MINSKLVASRYDNPCPICDKTNGNCRTANNELILCMTFADAIGEKVNGYKSIGKTKDGLWAKFILDSGNFPDDEKKREYQQFREAEEKARLERFKGSLSVEERDKNIRAIIKHLGLSEGDRQKLTERGLTDAQIDGKFATIKPFSELPETISTRLAGVYIGKNGKPCIGSDYSQGILVPVEKDGLFTGFQIRRDSKTNKYIWASTGAKKMAKGDRPKISSHLPNGELPITVFRNSENKQGYLCDGIAKSRIAYHRHNINIAGASGGNFLASSQQFLEILKDGYDIYVLDGGDILNRQVMNRLKILANWAKTNHNIDIKFAWYGQVKKANNDIDEVDKFEYDLLSIDELLELADKEQFNHRKNEQLLKLKRFTPDIIFESKYCLDELIKVDIIGKILALKAPMNTGKTYGINEIKKSLPNEKFILINNRRVLCSKLAVKLALEYINNEKDKTDVEEALSRATENEKQAIFGPAIVIDSLLKLKDTNYQDSIIIIDEANQLVESLFLSNTHIKSIRGRVIRLLSDIISKAKGVILADANLSDHTVHFFKSLNRNLEVLKLENTYQENHIDCYIHPTQEMIKSEIESSLADKENIFIMSDSAKELKAINDLLNQQGTNSVLLTQNSLGQNPELHRFLEDNGVAIKDENLSVLLLSPVGQSGISLEIGDHFSRVYGLFYGVVSTDTARQLLRRDRSQCDRHIWVAERGIGYKTDYDPVEVQATEDFKNEQVVIGSQIFSSSENQSTEQSILNWAKAITEGKDDLRKLSELTASELIVKNNIEKSDYKTILIEELKADGYNVIELLDEDLPYDDCFFEQIKARKKINERLEAKGINEAPSIDDSQAKVLENQDSLKDTERHKLAKYKIQQSLPEMPLDENLILHGILKDRWKLINGIGNYYLAHNPEVASILDHNNLTYQLNQVEQDGIFFGYDLKAKRALCDLFADLEIQKLIDSDETLDTKKIDSVVNRFKWHRQKLKIYNVKFNNKTYSTKTLKKVLELFGHTLQCVKQDKKTGDRFYKVVKMVYRIDKEHILDRFDDIYSAINRRYLGLIKKDLTIDLSKNYSFSNIADRTIDSKGLEVVTELADPIKSDPSSVTYSNQDTVRDRDLLLEKVPKTQEKLENEPIKTKQRFLNNLSNDYILAMSKIEFKIYSEKWLESGMSESELADLVTLREGKNEESFALLSNTTVETAAAANNKVSFTDLNGNINQGVIERMYQKGLDEVYLIKNKGIIIPCHRLADYYFAVPNEFLNELEF